MYIQKIYTHKLRNIPDWEIEVGEEKRNLIITGKNGSGKTTLLKEMGRFLDEFFVDNNTPLEQRMLFEGQSYKEHLSEFQSNLNQKQDFGWYFSSVLKIHDNSKSSPYDSRFCVYYPEDRKSVFQRISGISRPQVTRSFGLESNHSSLLAQHIVNLYASRSFANESGDIEYANRITKWFEVFENCIRELIENNDVEFNFNIKTFEYRIIETDKEPYSLFHLSSGYSSIFNILGDLILRAESFDLMSHDLVGIVLIDELEAHLHVSLQKKILPFLTKMFPKVQFIVTTHSPFVITSDPNATVCDLEKRIVVQDLSAYSYEAIVEGYYGADQYSEVLKEKVARYEALNENSERNIDEETELFRLKKYFQSVPRNFFSKELGLKLREIEGYGR